MTKKTKKSSLARDIIEQGIQQVKSIAAFFRNTSRDKRTVKSTKTALKELEQGRKPSQVAQDLGISTQKFVSLRDQIKKGKAYSPELRDILRDKQQERIQVESAARVTPIKPERDKDGVYIFGDFETLQKAGAKVEVIKTFPNKASAKKWWKTIINSGKYIALVKEKGGFYNVVAFGERSQRPKSRKVRRRDGSIYKKKEIEDRDGENRVTQIIQKYKGVK